MEDRVRNIIFDIVKEYNYSSIILFGSRARNDYNENSDYDLLIIMEDGLSIQELRKIQLEVRSKLALKNIDADILVKTKIIIDDYKDKKGNVIYQALKEGILIG